MKTFYKITFLLTTCILFLCCSGNDDDDMSTKPTENEPSYTVYMAGRDSENNAVYWENNRVTALSSADPNTDDNNVGAASIFVTEEKDVYVGGFDYNGQQMANYWKNGTAVNLTDGLSGSARVNSIYVRDGNVFSAGFEDNGTQTAVYWKNNAKTSLSDGSNTTGALDIAVSASGDVYVAGYENSGTQLMAVYWKNNIKVPLSGEKSSASSIFVQGNDIYNAGYINNGVKSVAVYWKNGDVTELTDGFHDATAKSVYVTPEGDIYVAGYEKEGDNTIACYWKNGTKIPLADYHSNAHSICVAPNGDVLISGSLRMDEPPYFDQPVYWKNDEIKILSEKGSAISIFIK